MFTPDEWTTCVASAQQVADGGVAGGSAEAWTRQTVLLETWCCSLMVETLRKFGAFTKVGDQASSHDLTTRHKIPSVWLSLMEAWLDTLAKRNVMARDGRTYRLKIEPPPSASITAEQRAACHLLKEDFEITALVAPHLESLLLNKTSVRHILCPGGSVEYLERIYRDSAGVNYIYPTMLGALRPYLQQQRGSEPLRVLELGAGTGSCSAWVLPELAKHSVDYYYTDVSQVFLKRAQKRFEEFKFVRYGIVDIDKDMALQGVPPQSIDVVVAACSVHTAKDMRASLRNVRKAMAPQGLLLLFEITELAHYEVTMGFLSGPWTDKDVRPGTQSIMPMAQWISLLAEEQITAAAVPGPEHPWACTGMQILIGRAQ